jgi:hypothetical protein
MCSGPNHVGYWNGVTDRAEGDHVHQLTPTTARVFTPPNRLICSAALCITMQHFRAVLNDSGVTFMSEVLMACMTTLMIRNLRVQRWDGLKTETYPVSEMLFSSYLEFRTLDKVITIYSECYTPSSELFRFYMMFHVSCTLSVGLKAISGMHTDSER